MRYRRRYNVWPAISAGLAGSVIAAVVAGRWMGTGGSYPVAAAGAFGLMMAAVLAVAGDRHPFDRFGAANLVTTARAALMALVAALAGVAGTADALWLAIGLTTIVALLDGMDGWLARRTGMASEFGARFDMETDAALILAMSVLVWQHD